MRQIKYPIGQDLKKFKLEYLRYLSTSNGDKINTHLNNIKFKESILTFERLVTLSFEDLIILNPKIRSYSNNVKKVQIDIDGKKVLINPFEQLFDYKSNHNGISNFFMRQSDIILNTCYYCGIEYINAFVDRDSYEGVYHFINNAPKKDLEKIKGIGNEKSDKIIKIREHQEITDIYTLDLGDKIINRIQNLEFVNSHNHFTLDHVLPQSDYKYYSLCLFNLVPSCYSCNSKFKKDIDFIQDSSINEICPSSSKYNLNKNITFKLYYKSKLKDINNIDDFEINIVVKNNPQQIEHYLSLFKISGRYNYHRNQLIPLIKNRIKYSDSKINEISNQLGMSQTEIKNLLFGEDVIQDIVENNDKPLSKLRNDIWSFINNK